MLLRAKLRSDFQDCFISVPTSLPASPVYLVAYGKGEAHFGWSGKRCAVDVIEMSVNFARCIGLLDGEFVKVSKAEAAYKNPIEVEPLDSSSSEILEASAAYLEEEILKQVSVLDSSLTYPIWVRGQSQIQIKTLGFAGYSLLNSQTELYVRVKSNVREVEERQTKLRVLKWEELYAQSQEDLGEVLVLKRSDQVYITSHYAGPAPSGHIISSQGIEFTRVQVSRLAYPGPNQPFTLARLSCKCSKSSFRVVIKSPHSDIKERLEAALLNSRRKLALFDGIKLRSLDLEVYLQPSQSDLGCIVLDPGSAHFKEAIKALVVETDTTKPPQTPRKAKLLNEVVEVTARPIIESQILPYFASGCPANFLLVHGAQGAGKATLLRSMEALLRTEYVAAEYLDCSSLSTREDKHLKAISEAYARAQSKWPSVLCLLNLESIAGKIEDEATEVSAVVKLMSHKTAVHLSQLISKENSSFEHKVKFIVTAQSPFHINKYLERYREDSAEITAPSAAFRGLYLEALVGVSSEELVGRTQSYLPADFQALARKVEAKSISEDCFVTEDLTLEVIAEFVPQTLQSLPVIKSTLKMSDIGGLIEPKRQILDTLLLPSVYEPLFRSYPLKLRSGILLYGPPGCGKTYLASAIPQECGLNFVSIKGPELLNKYIGASEQAIRDVFSRARLASPCVLFFDEFESIAPVRGSGSQTAVTDRVVNQLLCELDGVESRGQVYFVAATSRPEMLDPALLRPGRLDIHVYCPFPDHSDKVVILQHVLKTLPLTELDLERAARLTDRFTGADLNAVGNNLQIMLARREISIVDQAALELAISSLKPSLSHKQQQSYRRQYELFQARKVADVGTKTTQV
mmetsp:Transcript_1995/g.4473  ORF Transcript_1995/g.4473 Transcript_1995/m.4473 type:complete len:858 (+) Transcript_1995:40-2613(+)